MTDDQDFDALLQRSSLGTPAAQRLRARTSVQRGDDVRRIIELRNIIAHSSGSATENASRELAELIRSFSSADRRQRSAGSAEDAQVPQTSPDGEDQVASRLSSLADDTTLDAEVRVRAAAALATMEPHRAEAANHLRRLADDTTFEDAPLGSPDTWVAQSHERQEALATLSPRERQAVELRLRGLSLEGTARVMGISIPMLINIWTRAQTKMTSKQPAAGAASEETWQQR